MPKKQSDASEGEPQQRTDTGYEIPVSKKDDFFDAVGKAASTPKKPEESE